MWWELEVWSVTLWGVRKLVQGWQFSAIKEWVCQKSGYCWHPTFTSFSRQDRFQNRLYNKSENYCINEGPWKSLSCSTKRKDVQYPKLWLHNIELIKSIIIRQISRQYLECEICHIYVVLLPTNHHPCKEICVVLIVEFNFNSKKPLRKFNHA